MPIAQRPAAMREAGSQSDRAPSPAKSRIVLRLMYVLVLFAAVCVTFACATHKPEQNPAAVDRASVNPAPQTNRCTTDADCTLRVDGCYKVCASSSEGLRPRVACATCCDQNAPSCQCVAGQCQADRAPACGGFCN